MRPAWPVRVIREPLIGLAVVLSVLSEGGHTHKFGSLWPGNPIWPCNSALIGGAALMAAFVAGVRSEQRGGK